MGPVQKALEYYMEVQMNIETRQASCVSDPDCHPSSLSVILPASAQLNASTSDTNLLATNKFRIHKINKNASPGAQKPTKSTGGVGADRHVTD